MEEEEEEDVLRPPTQPPTRIIISLFLPSLALTRSEFRRWMSGVRANYLGKKSFFEALSSRKRRRRVGLNVPSSSLKKQGFDTVCHMVARSEIAIRVHIFYTLMHEIITIRVK